MSEFTAQHQQPPPQECSPIESGRGHVKARSQSKERDMTAETAEYMKTYADRWRHIAENEDGTLNLDAIARELADYDDLMTETRIEPLSDDDAKTARAECDEHGHDMTIAGAKTFIGRCRIGRGMKYCKRCRTAFFA